MQTTKRFTLHELLDTREERLVGNGDNIPMCTYGRTNTYQTVDTSFHTQITNLPIECRLIHTCLLDITEYQRMPTPLLVRTTIHEVEGDIQ